MLLPRYYFSDEFQDFEDEMKECGGKDMRFKKDSFLCPPGESLTDGYYIRKGLCKLSVSADNGSESLIAFFGEGSFFPLMTNEQDFSLEPYLFFYAVTDVDVIALPPEVQRALIRKDSDFAEASIDHYCRFCNLLLVRNLMSDSSDSLQKTAAFLYLYLYYMPDEDNIVHLSQETVASMTGVTRVQIARVINQLKKDGIIATGREKIQILKPEELKSISPSLVV
jgi:CRP-like cAMP-binding protein